MGVEESQTLVIGVLEQHDKRFDELQQTLDLHGGRLDRIEDNQQRLEDNQHRQFEHLSGQIVEILGVLRGPAAVDPPAPESER
ncbi:MAG: hypothetical protein ACRDTA_14635 [Pseudonocardiaceae bacterium]